MYELFKKKPGYLSRHLQEIVLREYLRAILVLRDFATNTTFLVSQNLFDHGVVSSSSARTASSS